MINDPVILTVLVEQYGVRPDTFAHLQKYLQSTGYEIKKMTDDLVTRELGFSLEASITQPWWVDVTVYDPKEADTISGNIMTNHAFSTFFEAYYFFETGEKFLSSHE